MEKIVGKVVSASFSDGIICRLEKDVLMPALGTYCTISSPHGFIFSMIIDVVVESMQQNISLPINGNNLFWSLFQRHNSTQSLKLMPLCLINSQGNLAAFSQMAQALSFVFVATDLDFKKIFGIEDFNSSSPKLCIGSPVGGQAEVCLDLKKFVERSNGIFGKTGTGKTFVTRMILAGLVRSDVAVNLIFDMHGEYGLSARSEDGEMFVLGLKSLFPEKVVLFSLDPEATRQRGCSPDVEVSFDLSEITVDDVVALQSELNLHSTAVEAANLLYVTFGKRWLYKLLSGDQPIKDLASQVGAHAESIGALFRKVKRIESLPFISKNDDSSYLKKRNVADLLIEYLDKKINVVLEFGRQTSSLTYLLVSGIVTRQIHRAYIKKTEKFLATQKREFMPVPLVITIEEAHKFLSSSLARQTIFGMIAREMRKYFVTLLVVDQRPSGICSEIISQLGTKISGKLEDERDLASIFQGINSQKNILSSLEAKGQVFVAGHAIVVPIIINVRRYDNNFYNIIQKSFAEKIPIGDKIDKFFF
jgi:DNA helicase HerA-like ATPase